MIRFLSFGVHAMTVVICIEKRTHVLGWSGIIGEVWVRVPHVDRAGHMVDGGRNSLGSRIGRFHNLFCTTWRREVLVVHVGLGREVDGVGDGVGHGDAYCAQWVLLTRKIAFHWIGIIDRGEGSALARGHAGVLCVRGLAA